MSRAPARTGRRTWLSLVVIAAGGIGLYVGLPQIAGLDETWGRVVDKV